MSCKNPNCNNEIHNKRSNKKFCCIKCRNFWHRNISEHSKNMYKEWCNKNKNKVNNSTRRHKQNTKKKFFEMYGDSCSCCDENMTEFLTLDHINNDGAKERKELGNNYQVYKKAIVDYRPDLYQTLCFNCNCAKGIYGRCPHKT